MLTTKSAAYRTLSRLTVLILLMVLFLNGAILRNGTAHAAADTSIAEQADRLYTDIESKNMQDASETFKPIKKWWIQNKADVKSSSLDLALEIDKQIAGLSLALLNEDADKSLNTAAALRFSLHNYVDGAFVDSTGKGQMTLAMYINKLQQARDQAQRKQWSEASQSVKQLQSQWLAVEGDVVSRSQSVYNNTERDLVLVDAYLSNERQHEQAAAVFTRMIDSLSPLASAGYSWWDAALIPLREGLEAVLVVGALLVAAGRSGSVKAKRWVVGGSAAGMFVCFGAGFAVVFLLSSTAFGGSNSLINGWTGVLSSVLLLYVSYWLHRNADIKKWNSYLNRQSAKAATTGKMISYALLAFFAILREGLETVIFLIGMAGKMPIGTLAAGIAVGFAILVAIAWLIIRAGSKLPVRPMFLVSSLVVFYLCFKFLGSGIHSLQMAGLVPSSVMDYLPQFASISLYPSWYSTLPQLLLVMIALIAVLISMFRRFGGRMAKTAS